MSQSKDKLSTESYKGVRDFYPEDMFLEDYIFGIMSQTTERFGYRKYSASILEPSELYETKSSEEIVQEQTYSFKDRGDRDVTLRPEMTPTIARMVAAKQRDLTFPLRWYSIPNLFRYERPQRGRLREHWQLNVDIFGVAGIEADVEIIQIAYQLMKNFGAKDSDFIIHINSRKEIKAVLTLCNFSPEEMKEYIKLLDKTGKIDDEELEKKRQEIIGSKQDPREFLATPDDSLGKTTDPKVRESAKELGNVILRLKQLGINNVMYDQSLTRGFDYYTGTIFEVYDTSPLNKRSLFGGGRYDNLLEIFGEENIPAVGFGMGDITMQNFLETHNLLPDYTSPTQLYICTVEEERVPLAQEFAQKLREHDISVAINYSSKKIGDQIKTANKLKVPFILCIGEDEISRDEFTIKNLKTGKEQLFTHVTENSDYKQIAEHVKNSPS